LGTKVALIINLKSASEVPLVGAALQESASPSFVGPAPPYGAFPVSSSSACRTCVITLRHSRVSGYRDSRALGY